MDIDWCPCGLKTNGNFGPYCSSRCKLLESDRDRDYSCDDSSSSSSLFPLDSRRLSSASSTSADCAAAASHRYTKSSRSTMATVSARPPYSHPALLIDPLALADSSFAAPLPSAKPRAPPSSTWGRNKSIPLWAEEIHSYSNPVFHHPPKATTLELQSVSPINTGTPSDSDSDDNDVDAYADRSTSDEEDDTFDLAVNANANTNTHILRPKPSFKFPVSSCKIALPLVSMSTTLPARSGNTSAAQSPVSPTKPSTSARVGSASTPTSSPTIVPQASSSMSPTSPIAGASGSRLHSGIHNIFRRKSEEATISSLRSALAQQHQPRHGYGYDQIQRPAEPLSVPTTSSSQALSGMAHNLNGHFSTSASMSSSNTNASGKRSAPIPMPGTRATMPSYGYDSAEEEEEAACYSDTLFPRARVDTDASVQVQVQPRTQPHAHTHTRARRNTTALEGAFMYSSGYGRGRERWRGDNAAVTELNDDNDDERGFGREDSKATVSHVEHVERERAPVTLKRTSRVQQLSLQIPQARYQVQPQTQTQQQRQRQQQQQPQPLAIVQGAGWAPQVKRSGVQRH